MKYRKKPVVIEAMQFVKGNEAEISAFVKDISLSMGIGLDHTVTEIGIPTLEGVMMANLNDWIIKGVKGEFYPCKPDIFEATYEECKMTEPKSLCDTCEDVCKASANIPRTECARYTPKIDGMPEKLRGEGLSDEQPFDFGRVMGANQMHDAFTPIVAKQQARIAVLEKELEHLKANHDDLVMRNKALRDRTDIPLERVESCKKLFNELDYLRKEYDAVTIAKAAIHKLIQGDGK